MHHPKICVVGSSNYDLIAYTNHLPKQGETVLGKDFKMGFGGKGANQAVASAKLGAKVTMVTKLGDDIFGQQTFENYKNLKIKTDFISMTKEAPSGVAPIWVDKHGHNSIIVVSGANDCMTLEELKSASSEIISAQILLCQNEIPFHITQKALEIAHKAGVTTIFNPAPAPTHKLSKDFFELIDMICPNETEAEILTNQPVKSVKDAFEAGRILMNLGSKKVIITLGANGCVLVTPNSHEHIEGHKVKATDTTGAGDCFIGSFAYFSACGLRDKESISRAQYVASCSVKKSGTQKSFPSASELPKKLFKKNQWHYEGRNHIAQEVVEL